MDTTLDSIRTASPASATVAPRRWPGRVLSGIPAAFLAFDVAIKLVNPPFVTEASVRIGVPPELSVPQPRPALERETPSNKKALVDLSAFMARPLTQLPQTLRGSKGQPGCVVPAARRGANFRAFVGAGNLFERPANVRLRGPFLGDFDSAEPSARHRIFKQNRRQSPS